MGGWETLRISLCCHTQTKKSEKPEHGVGLAHQVSPGLLKHHHKQWPPSHDKDCVQTANNSRTQHIKDLLHRATKAALEASSEENFRSFHWGELHFVTLLSSGCVPPKGLNNKNSNEIGEGELPPKQKKTSPVFFYATSNQEIISTPHLSSCHKFSGECISRSEGKTANRVEASFAQFNLYFHKT